MKTRPCILRSLLGAGAFVAVASTPLPAADDAAKVTVRWKDDRQTIDGFGACAREPEAEVGRTFPAAVRQKVLDALYSPERGIGLSFTRVAIDVGKDGVDPTVRGYRISTQWPSFQPEPGQYDWPSQDGLGTFLKEARATYPAMRFYGSCWSPPYWMKTNARTVTGGRLKPESYGEFAQFLAEWVAGYQERYGIRISEISPWNEPDRSAPWPSAQWSGEEQRRFIRDHFGPTFKKAGLEVGAVPGEHGAGVWKDVEEVLGDPAAAAFVTAVAAHQYGGPEHHATWFSPFQMGEQMGKRIWMTETCFGGRGGYQDDIGIGMDMAVRMARSLAQANFQAYMVWRHLAWARPAPGEEPRMSFQHDRESLMWAKADGTMDFSIKYHVMGQFSKFIRPGYVRVDADVNPSPDVWVAAFRSPERDRIVVVAVNAGATAKSVEFACDFAGEEIDALQVMRTSASERMADLGGMMATSGNTFTAELAPQSITTFHTGLERP